MSESYFEVEGRVVGNSQIEQSDNGRSNQSLIQARDASVAVRTLIHQYVTIVPQSNPQRSFVLDISDADSEFEPGTKIKIRISKED